MRTIIMNTTNVVNDGQNNKLVYKFPNSVLFKDSYITLSSAQMYYSWFNISSKLGNNIFYYNWRDALGNTTAYPVNIPDGLYEISTLNKLLQFKFISNGHYLVNSIGENVYYIDFIVNPSRYAVQINTYLFPTSLPAGYTNPAAVPFPPQTYNPVINLPPKINQIFGYISNFATDFNTNNAFVPPISSIYVSKTAGGTLSYISTTAPNVQPNSNLILTLSNIDNQYASPTGVCYTIIPNVSFGAVINERPPEFIWNKLIPGTYNQLTLNLLGTDLQPIIIGDPNMTFIFAIKEGIMGN